MPYTCAPADTSFDRTFDTTASGLQYSYYPSIGFTAAADPTIGRLLSYATGTQRYTFRASTGGLYSNLDESSSFGPEDIVAAKSSASVAVFEHSCYPGFGNAGYVVRLNLFRPGSGNDVLALSYSSFGSFRFSYTDPSGHTDDLRPFAYGDFTASTAARSGAATYSGVVSGEATRPDIANPSVYRVSGTMTLTVDFTAKSFSGTLALTATNELNQAFSYTLPITQTGASSLSTLSGSMSNGKFAGFLAGPNAEEAAGSFTVQVIDPKNSGQMLTLVGSGAAKR